MAQSRSDSSVAVAALPGLLGFLTGDQHAILAASAGLDAGGPRTLDEVAELLDGDPEVIFYQQALINRSLLQGIAAPDPAALRLVASLFVDGGVFEDVAWRGRFSLEGVVPALGSTHFPFTYRFSVVNLWSGGRAGETYPVGVRIKDPDGEVMLDAEQVLTAPGIGAQHVQQFGMTLTFPRTGLYVVEIWLIGAPLYAQPLPVLAYTPPAASAQPGKEGER